MFPWYKVTMLALESWSVVGVRVHKIARGGTDSVEEIRLMFAEKADAALETGAALMTGASSDTIVDRYRFHVAANEARLTA